MMGRLFQWSSETFQCSTLALYFFFKWKDVECARSTVCTFPETGHGIFYTKQPLILADSDPCHKREGVGTISDKGLALTQYPDVN